MMGSVSTPIHISALFIALVFTIAFFIIISVYACGRRAQLSPKEQNLNLLFCLLAIFGWLLFTMGVVATGMLTDFHAMPPRILIVTIPVLVFIALLFLSPKFLALTDHLDNFWLVYPQSFRIIMELILWLLYRYGVLPHQMTFEGRNFDILVGITAPFVAYYCFRRKTWPLKVALIWNIAGLILLGNIIAVAILSTPYPFRLYMNEPANTIVFHFPFVWLPSFVVPFALLLHLLSLRRLIRKAPLTEAIPTKNFSVAG